MPRQFVTFNGKGRAVISRPKPNTTKPPPKNQYKDVQHKTSHKMLILLPFWDGDRGTCNTLARLLADLEPNFSENADILFIARFDTEPDWPTVEAVSRKFNVMTYTSPKRMTGWPLGCNATFFGAIEHVYHRINSSKLPRYKVIFNMGADSCPLTKGWIEILLHAWDLANAPQPIVMAGALLEAGGRMHINGDAALLSGDLTFLKWLTISASNMVIKAGWDWHLAPQFERRGWSGFPFIKSIWQRVNDFTETDWINETSIGTHVIHGQKGFSLLDMARRKLL